MKRTSQITTAVLLGSLLIGGAAEAATVTFDSFRTVRNDNTADLNFTIDGGSLLPASGTAFSGFAGGAGNWTIDFESYDLLGDGGSYDGTVTIDVTTSNANASDDGAVFDAGGTRFTLNNGDALTLAAATLTLTDAAGSSNTFAAADLIVSFNSYIESPQSALTNNNEGVNLTAAGSGLSSPFEIRNGSANGEGVLDVTGAQTLVYTDAFGPSVFLFGAAGSFDVSVVPEPSSLALGLIGFGAVVARRRRG